MRPITLFNPARPLVTIAVAFAVGIVAGSTGTSVGILFGASCVLFAAAHVSRKAPLLAGGILIAFAAAGALRQLSATGAPAGDVSRFVSGQLVTVTGRVEGDAEIRQQIFVVLVAAQSVERSGERARSCTGLVSCTLVRGPGTDPPDHGDLVVARGRLGRPDQAGNPGGFDSREHLARRGIFSVLYVHRPGAWSASGGDSRTESFVLRASGRLRRSLAASAGHYLTPDEAGLLLGILVGMRSSVPPKVNDDFQLTGTAHILATAGLHVGLVALMLHGTMRAFGASRRVSAGLTIGLLIVYAIVAGGRPSVIRAVLVTDLFLAGYLLEREVNAVNSLALAALVLLAYRPGNLFDIGFQLSFATVASIIAIMSVVQPLVDRFIQRWTRALDPSSTIRGIKSRVARFGIDLAALTVAAQVGSAPLVAQYFNLVSPSGLPANLLIVPALFLILGLGFVFWIAALVGAPMVPATAAWLLRPLLEYVMWAARTCSRLPFGAVAAPSPGWVLIAAYYGILAVVVRSAQPRAQQDAVFTANSPNALDEIVTQP